MTPISSDVSLYELALATDSPPPVLQVSPATLKSVFSAFIDLLTDQELPAIVWAKLPRGDVWQTELERYSALKNSALKNSALKNSALKNSALESIPRAIYVFKNHREESADEVGIINAAIGDSKIDADSKVDADSSVELDPSAPDLAVAGTAAVENEATHPAWLEIELASESQLRREYFLLVWTAQFRGLILAHRPRSAQLAKTTSSSLLEAGGLAENIPVGAIDDSQERRQHLLILSSFDSGLIEQVLSGLENALTIDSSSPKAPVLANGQAASTEPSALPLTAAVAQWQALTATLPSTTIDPPSLGHLFMKQIQRQEEVWQRNAIYRRQAETAETLQLQNEELTNALRSREDFINTVGQELRTPLTTIKTALTLLNSPSLKPPQRQRYMDLIAKECDRQSSLITSLLDLVQLDQMAEQSALQSIRVSDVVPGVVSTYQPLAEEKGVMLAYTVPEDLPAIACMSNWLKQIVINLLHNGIKFTPQGGQVWVRAKQQGNHINLEFRDTGVGMAPNELPKIFDRFYRVRQSSLEDTSGAGLGLTIVQQLIIHCGGSISVKSKPGEGSTFNVLLPIRRSSPVPPS